MDRKTANKIYRTLKIDYPAATTALSYTDALQLLVSTILSAQCSDARVNAVTRNLFKRYRRARDYARAKQSDFEKEIKSTGFYKSKAKNIISSARMIVDNFGGRVPDSMEELTRLPGVARKTANIVLFHAYGKNEGIAVDTHVRRVSGRLGLTQNTDPVKIEQDLMTLFDRRKWGYLSNLLIEHGRRVCNARRPLCGGCSLKKLCPSFEKLHLDR